MSDEGFLERWSRRKRDVARVEKPGEEAAPVDGDPAQQRSDEHEQPPSDGDMRAAGKPELYLSQLPPLESITETTDIRAFLAPGVPASLRHAALRRAWSQDPSIRDFVGLSENSWDFTAPGGVPGFGPIGSPEEVRRLLAQLIGTPLEGDEEGAREPAAQADQAPGHAEDSPAPERQAPVASSDVAKALPGSTANAEHVNTGVVQHNKEFAALQQESPRDEYPAVQERRVHGGALPK
jgi:hypothetical protein